MRKVLTCVGTRPNFIKITQLEKAFKAYPDIEFKLLHTGQHFDHNMSEVFFKELGIRPPDVFLDVNKGSQIEVISSIMIAMEQFLKDYQPDLVMVPGDVNSTFACAFAASRLNIPVAHIESGLRSFDKSMPEEVNRILVDDIADLLFVTEKSGLDNLRNEQKHPEAIKFVGNTMIDSLVAFQDTINRSPIKKQLGLTEKQYFLITFHRPSNVDNEKSLKQIAKLLTNCSSFAKVVFPVHPRTLNNLKKYGLFEQLQNNNRVMLTEPFGYLDFLHLMKYSTLVMTDSGGIQEESTYLKVPCITVRNNTERPITVDIGTNVLIKPDNTLILEHVEKILQGNFNNGQIPDLWDGHASERIAECVQNFLIT